MSLYFFSFFLMKEKGSSISSCPSWVVLLFFHGKRKGVIFFPPFKDPKWQLLLCLYCLLLSQHCLALTACVGAQQGTLIIFSLPQVLPSQASPSFFSPLWASLFSFCLLVSLRRQQYAPLKAYHLQRIEKEINKLRGRGELSKLPLPQLQLQGGNKGGGSRQRVGKNLRCNAENPYSEMQQIGYSLQCVNLSFPALMYHLFFPMLCLKYFLSWREWSFSNSRA